MSNTKNWIYVILIYSSLLSQTNSVLAQIPHFSRIDTGALVNEEIRARGLYVVDYDMDGLLDLYIGNSTGVGGLNRPNLLFKNMGHGKFSKVSDSIFSTKIYNHNSGSNWADLDNDGDPDLYNDGEIFLNNGLGSFYLNLKPPSLTVVMYSLLSIFL